MLLALATFLFGPVQEPELDPFRNWDALVHEARAALEEFSGQDLGDLPFQLSSAEVIDQAAQGNRLLHYLPDVEVQEELLPQVDFGAIHGLHGSDGTIYIADTALDFQLTLSETTQRTLDDALFALLVHEGAHALAERLYDAEAMFVKAGKNGVDALLAANSVSEGWAQYVMFELCAQGGRSPHSLSEAGFRTETLWAARQEMARQGADITALTDDWWEALLDYSIELELYPYLEGERFVRRVLQERGTDHLPELFRNPPQTVGEVRNPGWYLDPQSQPELQVDTTAAEQILLEELPWQGSSRTKESKLSTEDFVAQFAPDTPKAHGPYCNSNPTVLWRGGYDTASATQFALAWILSDSTMSSLRTFKFHGKVLLSLMDEERWDESEIWPDLDFGFAGGLNIVHVSIDDDLGEGKQDHHLILVQRDRLNLVLALRRPQMSHEELFALAARMVRVATCPGDDQPIRVSPSLYDSIDEVEIPRIAMAPVPPIPEIFDQDDEEIPPAILAYEATATVAGQVRASSLYLIQPKGDYSRAWDVRHVEIHRDSTQQSFGVIGDLSWARGRSGDRGFVALRSDVPRVDYWRERFDFEHELIWQAPAGSPVRALADIEAAPAQNPRFDELFLLSKEHAQVWTTDAIGEAQAELVAPGRKQWQGIDLELADVDRDGVNDVFVACTSAQGVSAIELLQRKAGEWASSGSLQMQGEIHELLLAKLDPTAPHEIWATIQPAGNEALVIARWVLTNGRWERQADEAVQGTQCYSMQVADSDCDQALEVIVGTDMGVWSMRPTRFGWDTKALHQEGLPIGAEAMVAVLSNEDGSGSDVYSIPQDGQSLMRWVRDQDVQDYRYWSEPVLLLDPPKTMQWSPIPLFAAEIKTSFRGLIALPPGHY